MSDPVELFRYDARAWKRNIGDHPAIANEWHHLVRQIGTGVATVEEAEKFLADHGVPTFLHYDGPAVDPYSTRAAKNDETLARALKDVEWLQEQLMSIAARIRTRSDLPGVAWDLPEIVGTARAVQRHIWEVQWRGA